MIAPSAAVQLALYRIAQESLTNVLRHAKATAVTVVASEEEGSYLLEITDNGTGGPSGQDIGGRGLLGMHERAELLGGSLTAGPLETGGFRVSARIPQPAASTPVESQLSGLSDPGTADPGTADPETAGHGSPGSNFPSSDFPNTGRVDSGPPISGPPISGPPISGSTVSFSALSVTPSSVLPKGTP